MIMRRYVRKCLLAGLILVSFVSVVGLAACTKPAPALAPGPVPTPTTTPSAKMTQEQAQRLLIARLSNLAQTSEAKEYVTIFLKYCWGDVQYLDAERGWLIEWTAGPESGDLIEKAPWFGVTDIEYFWEVHWEHAFWMVYDDGKISPAGPGLVIEADIDQLNRTRMLK